MELDKDFREFIELLNGHKVKYLVIGGYAVNYHGYPRYTKDIDFWIFREEENIGKLIDALNDFGFGSLGLQAKDFMKPENIIQLGREPYRIDLLVDVEGLDFKACFDRRSEAELDGVKTMLLSLKDLILAKKKAGRLQDLADAEQLDNIDKRKNK